MRTAVVAVIALTMLSPAASGAAPPVPKAVFSKLQAVPVASSELPPGFQLPTADEAPHPGYPTAWSPSRPVPWQPGGAELAFAVRGPDQVDLLGFTVYESPKQALAALPLGPRGHHFGFAPANAQLVGKIPGYPNSTLWKADLPGALIYEADVITSGFVTVRSLTVVTGQTGGDVPSNLALVKAGLKHLAAVLARKP
jgi:hypothetical protein